MHRSIDLLCQLRGVVQLMLVFGVGLHCQPSNGDDVPSSSAAPWPPVPDLDSRYIASTAHSTVLLEMAYLDQPYCVVAPGTSREDVEHQQHATGEENASAVPRWVCVITGDEQHEGGAGEQVLSLWSDDYGKTWSSPVPLEPNNTLANAYSTIAITDFGRIYAMYNYNADNITTLPDGKPLTREDELGHFVMKYSDDRGMTWSKRRFEIPYRMTSIDQNNTWSGKVPMMWSVDQCKLSPNGQDLFYSFTKIGQYAYSPPEEVWFLKSSNIMTERDASQIEWELLPNGDHGLPPPGGNPNIAEEGHIMPLHDDRFYAIFRTTQGLLAACSSKGKSANAWNNCDRYFAEYSMSLSSDAHFLKNPRGPITMKQFSNGRFLLLYYNNGNTGFVHGDSNDGDGGVDWSRMGSPDAADNSRNPYWLSSGIATDEGVILWSQPEIIIYDRVPSRPGYPDFIEIPSTGQIFITETQKTTARLHPINSVLLEKLWSQDNSTVIAEDIAARYEKTSGDQTMEMAPFPTFGNYTRQDDLIQGFTLIFWLAVLTPEKTEVLLTSYEHDYHKGIDVTWTNTTINFTASDNQVLVSCTTDSVCSSRLLSNKHETHQLAVTVDNGPMMITLIVDGVVCDGATDRARGQCWMNNQLRDVNGLAKADIGDSVQEVLIYNRALFNSEVVANYNNHTTFQL